MPCDAMLQRHAIQTLHGDEVLPLSLVNLEDHADVGMVQGRCGLSFALEAFQRLRVMRQVVWQELQRDKTVESRIFRLVDNAHTAAAEFLDDSVMRDGL